MQNSRSAKPHKKTDSGLMRHRSSSPSSAGRRWSADERRSRELKEKRGEPVLGRGRRCSAGGARREGGGAIKAKRWGALRAAVLGQTARPRRGLTGSGQRKLVWLHSPLHWPFSGPKGCMVCVLSWDFWATFLLIEKMEQNNLTDGFSEIYSLAHQRVGCRFLDLYGWPRDVNATVETKTNEWRKFFQIVNCFDFFDRYRYIPFAMLLNIMYVYAYNTKTEGAESLH